MSLCTLFLGPLRRSCRRPSRWEQDAASTAGRASGHLKEERSREGPTWCTSGSSRVQTGGTIDTGTAVWRPSQRPPTRSPYLAPRLTLLLSRHARSLATSAAASPSLHGRPFAAGKTSLWTSLSRISSKKRNDGSTSISRSSSSSISTNNKQVKTSIPGRRCTSPCRRQCRTAEERWDRRRRFTSGQEAVAATIKATLPRLPRPCLSSNSSPSLQPPPSNLPSTLASTARRSVDSSTPLPPSSDRLPHPKAPRVEDRTASLFPLPTPPSIRLSTPRQP